MTPPVQFHPDRPTENNHKEKRTPQNNAEISYESVDERGGGQGVNHAVYARMLLLLDY